MSTLLIVLFILNFYIVICIKQKRQSIITFPTEEPTDDEKCFTPNRRLGTCIQITRCPELRFSNDFKFLRRSICGFEGRKPMVCCPLSQPEPIVTEPPTMRTTKRRTPPPPTKRPVPVTLPTTAETLPNDGIPDGGNDKLIQKPKQLPDACGNTSILQMTRIVGGEPSLPGAWPWMVSLFIEDLGRFSPMCGGALVSDTIVITASHCVVENGKTKSPSSFMVRLGEHNIDRKAPEDVEEDYAVSKVISHPEFEANTYRNDIAILILSKRAKLSERVWPVCLPYDSDILRSDGNVGRSGFITGWGRVSFNGPSSDVLQQATVEIQNQTQCAKAFERFVKITKVYMCAGTIGSVRDSCQGDSGGPLVQIDPEKHRYYLTGVVSFGRRCATPGFPGVYARVSEFLNWISKNI